MKVALTLRDDAMPRTVYYDRLLDAVRRNPRFVEDESEADLLLPAEDVALETNWPRYGNQSSAFIRPIPGPNDRWYHDYLSRLEHRRGTICVVNMHAFMRLPQHFKERANILVADVSLPLWERTVNPRTVSMPALPIAVANGHRPAKTVIASFRGVLSHPCRKALARLHNGKDLICEIVDRQHHAGRIDATAAAGGDEEYGDLLARSIFAFVPRGDALFSYRLLEALSFGCIPIIISDGWVLPFDKTVTWSEIALHVPEAEVRNVPRVLQAFPFPRLREMQERIAEVYASRFATLDAIVETLFGELKALEPLR